jgi:hypothetical protein|eukprot:COSAG01_NODE_3822_length_5661_cov_3.044065_1_plen_82_part_00
MDGDSAEIPHADLAREKIQPACSQPAAAAAAARLAWIHPSSGKSRRDTPTSVHLIYGALCQQNCILAGTGRIQFWQSSARR